MIVVSLELFAALHVGAPFGYVDYAVIAGWAALGNVVGGLVFVTLLRFIQVGGGYLAEVRGLQDAGPSPHDGSGEPHHETPPDGARDSDNPVVS
ncbi:hypothetical protein BH20ACT9_BH20ACT9_22090 [soil metagenome]